MDEKAFGAMITPILNMVNAGLPDVKEIKTEPGKLVETILENIMKDSPFYPLIRKCVLPEIEENPGNAEKALIILTNQLNQYFNRRFPDG